jgi:hypothetical protein
MSGHLSCYIANLAEYLAKEMPDYQTHIAKSVRLAVRTDLPDGQLAFSHHNFPLDRLPDGTRLRYATGDPGEELARHGRVLVMTDNAKLPWSPSTTPAPHWLLVEARNEGGWFVSDKFAGLLPTGEQHPYEGWMSASALTDAMTPAEWTPGQSRRSELAFGFPVSLPDGPLWLQRGPDDGHPAELPGQWLFGDDEVLPFLAEHVATQGAGAQPYLDDLWTAAQHRAYAYRWFAESATAPDRLIEMAVAWEQLPSALRFAVDSARRGRPRVSLVRTTFDHLLELSRKEAG